MRLKQLKACVLALILYLILHAFLRSRPKRVDVFARDLFTEFTNNTTNHSDKTSNLHNIFFGVEAD